MHRVHLSTGVIVTVADVHAAAIKDAMRAQTPRPIAVSGAVAGRTQTPLEINPLQVVLLERL